MQQTQTCTWPLRSNRRHKGADVKEKQHTLQTSLPSFLQPLLTHCQPRKSEFCGVTQALAVALQSLAPGCLSATSACAPFLYLEHYLGQPWVFLYILMPTAVFCCGSALSISSVFCGQAGTSHRSWPSYEHIILRPNTLHSCWYTIADLSPQRKFPTHICCPLCIYVHNIFT